MTVCYNIMLDEGRVAAVTDRSALLFMPDDTRKTGLSVPLFLYPAAGTPLLTWLVCALRRMNIRRYFLVCGSALMEQTKACFPEDVEVISAGNDDVPDALHVFLSTSEDTERDILVFTGPAVWLPEFAITNPSVRPTESGACAADRSRLMDFLDTEQPLLPFFRDCCAPLTDRDGFFAVKSAEDLQRRQPALTRGKLDELIRGGVRIWDTANCWVSPEVTVGADTELLPGTVLTGKTEIGRGCRIGPQSYLTGCTVKDGATVESSRAKDSTVCENAYVGPFAHLRPGTVIGAGSKAGAFTEMKNTVLGESVSVSHLSYLGDCTVGSGGNIGCGTVTANFDRVKKEKTVIGDKAFIGCNSTLVAPVNIGAGAYIGAGSVITEDVPESALALARARQTVRRDWAEKNKQPEEEK